MNLINWKEILKDELIQLQEEGRNIEALKDELEKVLEKEIETVKDIPPIRADFPFFEPLDWNGIVSESQGLQLKQDIKVLSHEQLHDKVYGAWLARSIGCLLGKPVEGWPRSDIRKLLVDNSAYPLMNYFSNRYEPENVEEWMKKQYVQNAIEYCKFMPRDDDMDYTILALKIMETFGENFTSDNVGTMWLYYLPPFMTYTAERAAYINMCSGINVPDTAVYLNPYREWIGAQIRSDFYGYINPGDPARAAEMAFRDASVSHVGNGVFGAMFIAGMNAASLVETDIEKIIRTGMSVIPRKSRLHEAIEWVITERNQEPDWEEAGNRLLDRYGSYHRVHTINNAAIVTLALLYGEGDLEKTIGIATMMGLDTDCNAASAGSIIGGIKGALNLPEKWVKPLHDQIESYLAGEGAPHISKLASRTISFIHG